MKKSFIITTLVCIALLLANLQANAKDDINILSTSGTTTVTAEPDTAIFTLAVETENKILNSAMEENTAKSTKVVAEIKKLLGKDDSIKTSGFNVSPVYNYDSKLRKSILKGYKVTNSVTVKTKKTDKVGNFIDRAVSLGANRVQSLNFTVEDKDKYSDILLTQASKEAKQKALITAKALGVCIKGVKRVSTGYSSNIIQPQYNRAYAMTDSAGALKEAAPPPIEEGEVTLQSTVSVDFIIENIK